MKKTRRFFQQRIDRRHGNRCGKKLYELRRLYRFGRFRRIAAHKRYELGTRNPAEGFRQKGQEITLKVVRLDPAEKRINLSLKHFGEDPWLHFEEKYHVNDIVKGRVTKLADFGAFIELEEGIEGLVHISEFSWVKKSTNRAMS